MDFLVKPQSFLGGGVFPIPLSATDYGYHVDSNGDYYLKVSINGAEYFLPLQNSVPGVTPTITPTITPSISLTPSITPTISETPTETPPPTETPTGTPEPTPTPTASPVPFITVETNNEVIPLTNSSAYLIVDELINTFTLSINSRSISFNNFFDENDQFNCYINALTSELVTCEPPIIYLTNSAVISTIDDDRFTLTFYNTGSFVLGFSLPSTNLPAPTPSPTPNIFLTPTQTRTPTPTLSPTRTPNASPTVSITPTFSATATPTPTKTLTPTPSKTPITTPTVSPTPTITPTRTATIGLTPTPSKTTTNTPTVTPSRSLPNPSSTPSSTRTPTPTRTPTRTLGSTPTATPTFTPTSSVSPTINTTRTPTRTPTISPIPPTPTPSLTPVSVINIESNNEVVPLSTNVSNYIIVNETINTFTFNIDETHSISFINNYDPDNLSNCYLIPFSANALTCDKEIVFVTESALLSTNEGEAYTFYYYTTGSLLLGFSLSSTPLPNPTPTPSPNLDYSPTPSPTYTVTPTKTPTKTPTPSVTSAGGSSPTPTPTTTKTPTATRTPNITLTPSFTVTRTNTITPTVTPTISPSSTSNAPTPSSSASPTPTPTRTTTPTLTPTVTRTNTSTPPSTPVGTATPSLTKTPTPTRTLTRNITPGVSSSQTPTPTPTPSVTETLLGTIVTATPTISKTPTQTITNTPTPSLTSTVTNNNINVTNSGASSYIINSQNNPTITLNRNQTYVFNINASGHPFWIKTAQITGTGNSYNSGVDNNGVQVGVLTFTVPNDAPTTLYYICQFHSNMSGIINIPELTPTPTATTTVTPTPTQTVTPTTLINGVLFNKSSFVGVVNEPYLSALNSAVDRWNNFIQINPTVVQSIRGFDPAFNGISLNTYSISDLGQNSYIAACGVASYVDLQTDGPGVQFCTYRFNLFVNTYYAPNAEPYYFGQQDWANIMTHELGHALGIGIYWDQALSGVGAVPPQNFFLSGGAYVDCGSAYSGIIGSSRPLIPLEQSGGSGTALYHWEDNFRNSSFIGAGGQSYPGVSNELMVAYYDPGINFIISNLSLGVLTDFGYQEKNPGTNEGTPTIISSLMPANLNIDTSSGDIVKYNCDCKPPSISEKIATINIKTGEVKLA